MILTDKVKYLSMGCDAYLSTCSKCGNAFSEDYQLCDCLANDKGKYYLDAYGKRRIILTEVPAFHGAVKRNVMRIKDGVSVALSMPEDCFRKQAVQKYLSSTIMEIVIYWVKF